MVGAGSESNVSPRRLCENRLQRPFLLPNQITFFFPHHLPRSFSVPLLWVPLLTTEQRPGAHIQRGGQVADNVSHLARQESQVGQGDDEEAHVQEVQQLLVRAGLSPTL